VVLAASLAAVSRVGAGEIAAALGPYRAGVEDQIGVAAQHGGQERMDLRQQASSGPARQAAAQGRTAGLIRGGRQAAPGRALTQKAPQCRHDPDGLARRVARPMAWLLVAGVDDCGNKMKESEVQCCYPCVWCPRLGQSQRRTADQDNSTLSSCENCL
jgi:hypothetical protein